MVSENMLVSISMVLVDIIFLEMIYMFGRIIYDDFKENKV